MNQRTQPLCAALGAVLVAAGAVAVVHPAAERLRQEQRAASRLAALERGPDSFPPACPVLAPSIGAPGSVAQMAGWQSIGGCGAGASSSTGSGIRWIGRDVSGGLFRLECQMAYVEMPYGYNAITTAVLTRELDDRWSLGVAVPYLQKYMRDPYAVGIDLANRGIGDVSAIVARKFGATRAWLGTLTVGLPTGEHEARFRNETLPQDRQLGLGKPTATLTLDHTIDRLDGLAVVGGSASWRGGENAAGSYRGPTASVFGYVGSFWGRFVPAAGLSVTAFADKAQDLGQPQATPAASVAANLSVEWSLDWMALLAAASLPYDFAVSSPTLDAHNRRGPWVLSLGVAFAPF